MAEVRYLTRGRAVTDPAHGQRPSERSIEDHLRLGVVNLDKPSGPTSHQVVAWLKTALDIGKAGHGGTLDPNVTGVLPVALLDATRVVKTLLEAPKEYVCVFEAQGDINADRARKTLESFRGPIYQVPPLKSAVKRELRVRNVYELEVNEIEGRQALFRVLCEAGTYIRKICTDAGVLLHVGGHMRDLRRTRTGPFSEATSVTMHDVKDAFAFWKEDGDESWLRDVVRPVEELVGHLPRVTVRDSAVDAICHGASLAVPGVVKVPADVTKDQLVSIFTMKDELVAVGRALLFAEEMVTEETGLAVKPSRVVMPPGTYPRVWGQGERSPE